MRRTLMTALAGVLLVGGCTGDPEPVTTPGVETPTVSPTPSPSPTPTVDAAVPPERPAAMAEASADGAAAAAAYFLSLYPYIFATGDLAEWDAMSDAGCGFCANTRASVLDQAERGVTGEGSEITVLSATGLELAPSESYAADLEIRQGPSFEVHPDGTRAPDGDGGQYRMHLALWWRDGWLVRAADVERF